VSPIFQPISSLLAIILVLALSGRHAIAAPKIVVSIAPLHSLVAAVMAGGEPPRLLLRGGESPHTFSLRPSDASALANADALFWIGPQLERPLARILPNLGISASVAMLDTPGLNLLSNRPLDTAGHEQINEHRHTDHTAEHAAVDPHIWLSPANATVMTDEIARVLTHLDPMRADLYRTNAAQLKDRLAALDRRLAAELADVTGSYAVFHDAYQYFERRYSLQPVAVVNTHAERSPGAAHLRALRATLVDQQVRCLFSEPQFQPRLVAMLSEGLPLRHAVLDPLGAEIPPGPQAYFRMMHSIADTLEQCMQEGSPP
jgi:zinc transport system substrate-binding protein